MSGAIHSAILATIEMPPEDDGHREEHQSNRGPQVGTPKVPP